MAKRVLVIHYSQSGQLTSIVSNLCDGLGSDVIIDHAPIEPSTPFPFPWNRLDFFNTFPESVFGTPLPINPVNIDESVDYDLIVLAYTVWYMAPCIPINSFLNTDIAKRVLKGKKVVTLIGARNMWVMAQERMKGLLKDMGAQLVGNVALVDRNPNLVSIVTIIRWMFYGKKDPFWGFPRAGILEEDIDSAKDFGKVVGEHLLKNELSSLNQELLNQGAVFIDPALLILEKRASRIFKLYGNFILAKGEYGSPNRLGRVSLLSYLIPTGALILSPLTTIAAFVISRVKRKTLNEEIDRLKRCD